MSILSIEDYKLIEEEAREYADISRRIFTLLLDMGSDPAIAERFATKMESDFEDATSVSFITAYKNYVIPKNYAGVALVKWLNPDPKNTKDLTPDDFYAVLFIAQKAVPTFTGASNVMEEFIKVEAESRQYAYELKESLKL